MVAVTRKALKQRKPLRTDGDGTTIVRTVVERGALGLMRVELTLSELKEVELPSRPIAKRAADIKTDGGGAAAVGSD